MHGQRYDNSQHRTTKKKLKNKPPTKPPEAATENAPAAHPTTEAEDLIRYLYDQISPS